MDIPMVFETCGLTAEVQSAHGLQQWEPFSGAKPWGEVAKCAPEEGVGPPVRNSHANGVRNTIAIDLLQTLHGCSCGLLCWLVIDTLCYILPL